MLHFPVSFMNGLNQAETAVCQFYRLELFPNDPLFRLFRDHNTAVVAMPYGGRRTPPRLSTECRYYKVQTPESRILLMGREGFCIL